MITTSELFVEFKMRSQQVDDALAYLRKAVTEWADAEEVYRREKAKSYLAHKARTRQVADAKSLAEIDCSKLMHACHIADGMKQAALENVRARRAQLSALQSIAAMNREEAGFAKTGPQFSP